MSNHKAHPLGGKLVSWPVLVLAPFAVLCGMLILKRLFFGLGSVTDLNGGYPWGLWISFDLLISTGFACGGWALAWAVYVFNRGEYTRWCDRRCWRACLATRWAVSPSPSTWGVTGTCRTSTCPVTSTPPRCCSRRRSA